MAKNLNSAFNRAGLNRPRGLIPRKNSVKFSIFIRFNSCDVYDMPFSLMALRTFWSRGTHARVDSPSIRYFARPDAHVQESTSISYGEQCRLIVP